MGKNLPKAAGGRKGSRTPTDTFPLFLRSDGRYAKKINGVQVYFGRDHAEALAAYHRHIGRESLGLEPDAGELGLRELFNQYLSRQERQSESGKISPRTVADSIGTLRRVSTVLGDRPVSSLTPTDFRNLEARLAKGRSIVTTANDIRRTKAAFAWALTEGLIEHAPKYGSDFKPAPARAFRLEKARGHAKLFTAEEIRQVLTAAPVQLRAWILLGINAALLPIDLSRLTFDEFNLKAATLCQPRGKTGVDRKCHLWSETLEALNLAIEGRAEPASPIHADLVFLTETGLPIVRTPTPSRAAHDPKAEGLLTVINRPSSDLSKLLRSLGLNRKGRGFGSLRHTFLTVAESGLDFPAVAAVMGHHLAGTASHYREGIAPERIKAVCEIVHDWLFPAKPRRNRNAK